MIGVLHDGDLERERRDEREPNTRVALAGLVFKTRTRLDQIRLPQDRPL